MRRFVHPEREETALMFIHGSTTVAFELQAKHYQ